MVKFILGAKGIGKTRWLVENANKDMKEGNGNIAFIDVDDDHIFTLNHKVRLINAMEFNILNVESFYGFLCGVVGMDYDLEKVYIDSIYKVIDLKANDLEKLVKDLTIVGEKFDTKFYINLEQSIEEIPKNLKVNCIEL